MIALKDMTKIDNFPKWLVVHHTGGTDANPLEDTSHHTFEIIQDWHLSLGYENFGYHFLIEKDGTVRVGRPTDYRGAHERAVNFESIGICLSGNFDATDPTPEQEKSLAELLVSLSEQYNIPKENIVPHRHFKVKTCFGNRLEDDWAQNLFEEASQVEVPVVESKMSLLELILEILFRIFK